MTRPIMLVAAALSALFVTGGPAAADSTSAARKAIQAAYSKQSQAIMKADAAAYRSTHDKAFVEVDQKGKSHSIEAIISFLGTVKKSAKNIKHTYTVTNIIVTGKEATANVSEQLSGDVENPNNKALIPMGIGRAAKDTWVRVGTAWKRKASKILSETRTIDRQKVG
jgi:hypothetical protein